MHFKTVSPDAQIRARLDKNKTTQGLQAQAAWAEQPRK